MYSYKEFKKLLDRTYGFSEKEIFYIIGVFFDKTYGFTITHEETFYDLKDNAIVYIEWSIDTYSWGIEVDEIW